MLQTTSTVKRIRWMSLLTIILLAFSAFVVYPPKRSLRLGKDLSGGVSLVYTVQVAPGEDAKAVISNTIDVLKKRVDPQGVSEISMVQQGRDRIEITMPLPNAEVKAKKAAFEDALNRLSKSAINPNQLDQFMRMSAAERAVKLEEMAAGKPVQREIVSHGEYEGIHRHRQVEIAGVTSARAESREAIATLAEGSEALGRHLATAVRAGPFCVYDPR